MIQGSCHCGTVQWRFDDAPGSVTACNCTVCRRYGALWAYGFENEGIDVSGATEAYVPGASTAFHFCPACGCAVYWRELQPGPLGRRRIAVNVRLAAPEQVARIPVDRVNGLGNFEYLPSEARCVADYWF
jgi:hypothetical protein